MKSLLLVAVALFGFSTLASEEAPKTNRSPGRVICSTVSPRTTGFEVLKVRTKAKDYTGSFVVDNLRISGSYWLPQNLLKISVVTMDEEGEDIQEILFSESKLLPGSIWHSKTKHGDVTLDMYCHFLEPGI